MKPADCSRESGLNQEATCNMIKVKPAGKKETHLSNPATAKQESNLPNGQS